MNLARYRILLTAWAVTICINVSAQPVEPQGAVPVFKPDSLTVLKAAEMYEQGRLGDAEFLALRALDAPNGMSKRDRAQLFQVLAFCAIANDDEENGKRQFIEALRLNPNLSPDPISWSPKVRRVFDKAREDYVQIVRIQAIENQSREADLCRRASLQSLYFPGRGQWVKNQKLKGFAYGSLFWASLAVFAYSETALPGARSDYLNATRPDQIEARYQDYRSVSRRVIISGSVAGVIYAYTFFDALWSDSQPAKAVDPPR